MVRSAVRVVVRTRPTDSFTDSIKVAEDGKSIQVHVPRGKESGTVNNAQEHFSYNFNNILHNSPQEMVYAVAAHEVVESTLQGYNGTIMTYGQTGAGKTYTMTGGNDFRSRGVIPRAVSELFSSITQLPDKSFEVTVSYMEIYNERLFDLLDGGGEDLSINEDAAGHIYVKGLSQRPARSETEALSHLFDGNTNRATAEHALNPNSSRSHCVFTVYIRSRSRMESDGHVLASKLHLIDLAGSERVSKTHSDGALLREAMFINKSLSFLEQVVIALSAANRPHVPFRQSKLTNLLKDSLGGNSKTTLIANVWCEARYLEETVSTLKFAQRMMRIQNDATVNIVIDPSAQIKMLQRQIVELKAELQMQNQLHGKGNIKYDEFSEEERHELQKKVDKYLEGPPLVTGGELPDCIEVRNLREVKEYFRIFHNCVKRAEAEANLGDRAQRQSKEDAKGGAAAADDSGDPGMGEIDGAGGFGVGSGVAGKGLRQAIAKGNAYAAAGRKATPEAGDAGGKDPAEAAMVMHVTLPDKGQAYEDFKSHEGAQLAELLRKSVNELKEKKKAAAEAARLVNEEKANIDRLRQLVDAKRRDREGDDDDAEAIDEDEFAALKGLKQGKQRYRQLYEEAQSLRTQREYSQRMVDQARQKLITDFEEWYERTYHADSGGGRQQARDDGERLDEGERFDRMEEERLMEEDPDALEFYKAQKMSKGPRPPRGTGGRGGRGTGFAHARTARQR